MISSQIKITKIYFRSFFSLLLKHLPKFWMQRNLIQTFQYICIFFLYFKNVFFIILYPHMSRSPFHPFQQENRTKSICSAFLHEITEKKNQQTRDLNLFQFFHSLFFLFIALISFPLSLFFFIFFHLLPTPKNKLLMPSL